MFINIKIKMAWTLDHLPIFLPLGKALSIFTIFRFILFRLISSQVGFLTLISSSSASSSCSVLVFIFKNSIYISNLVTVSPIFVGFIGFFFRSVWWGQVMILDLVWFVLWIGLLEFDSLMNLQYNGGWVDVVLTCLM